MYDSSARSLFGLFFGLSRHLISFWSIAVSTCSNVDAKYRVPISKESLSPHHTHHLIGVTCFIWSLRKLWGKLFFLKNTWNSLKSIFWKLLDLHDILHEYLDMRKLCSKWVLPLLIIDQNNNLWFIQSWCLEMSKRKTSFIMRYQTMDETCIHLYYPESNR